MNRIPCKQCGRIHQFHPGKDCFYTTSCWAKLRSEQLKLDNHTCRICNNPGQCVHHSYYDRGFGNEIVGQDLITLCDICHEVVTSSIRQRRYDAQSVEVVPHVARDVNCPFVPADNSIPDLTKASDCDGRSNKNQVFKKSGQGSDPIEIPAYRNKRPDPPQWGFGRPSQQVCEGDEKGLVEKDED